MQFTPVRTAIILVVALLGLLMLARESGWFVRARVIEPQPA